MVLEDSECYLGYPREQVIRVVGTGRIAEFDRWMNGQTMAICEGRYYDHAKGEYVPSPCSENPHGGIVYPWDIERFLAGKPIID